MSDRPGDTSSDEMEAQAAPTEEGYAGPTGLRVTELYAWVSLDDGDGNEGIIGYLTADGFRPAIGADRGRIEQLRPIIRVAARMHTHPIELRRFSTMTVEETMEPGSETSGLKGERITMPEKS
jgi:hypothetical protein